jgi:GGDEF domain-containing protein
LLSCVESMSHETQSLMARMHNELAAVEQRLRESEVTDPLTGLMCRREMERQIEARKGLGAPPVLLHFQLSGEISDEIARQVGARLGSQFRHKDFVCRWTENEFLVLFQGPAEIAQARSEQIVPWVSGRYVLDNGETIQVDVEVKLLEAELIA